VVAAAVLLDLPLIDLSDKPEAGRESSAKEILQQEARRPFDLSQGPLIRSILVRLSEQEHILLVTMHHIVTDGWSVGVFSASCPRSTKRLPPAKHLIYLNCRSSIRTTRPGSVDRSRGSIRSQLSYWKKQFTTLPQALELPTDHPRPSVQALRAFRGAHHTICLSKQLTNNLKQLSQKQGVTLFMTLLAAYETLLYRYTGEEDIVVGTPIAGRQCRDREPDRLVH